MSKLSRRDFLKRLVLISSIPFIKGVDLEALKDNISDFSAEQLENIRQVKRIEVKEYDPYLTVSNPFEYVIYKSDNSIEHYTDIRPLKEKYGNLINYWNESTGDKLPDNLHSPRYDKDDWLL